MYVGVVHLGTCRYLFVCSVHQEILYGAVEIYARYMSRVHIWRRRRLPIYVVFLLIDLYRRRTCMWLLLPLAVTGTCIAAT